MYDPDGLVDDYVVAYVAELARHADVFVLADGSLEPGQLDRLSAATGAWVRAHGGHDFGSWSLLAGELVGWEALAAYDEVLLANDSCWLLRPLDEVFAEMDARPGDFWGLQLTARRFEPEPSQPQSVPLEEVKRSWLPPTAFRYPELVHVGSYFLALRRPVLDDPGFRRRLDAVRPQRDRANLVQKYETGTTQYLVGQGFDFSTWVPELRPNHPIYGPGVFDLLAEGFPLFKRRFLVANPYDTPDLADWKAAHPGRRPRRAGRRVRAQPAPCRRSGRAGPLLRDPVVGIVRDVWPVETRFPQPNVTDYPGLRSALGLVGDLDEAGGAGGEGVLGADPVGGGPAGGVVTEDRVGVGEGGEPGQVVRGLVDLDPRAEQLGQPGHVEDRVGDDPSPAGDGVEEPVGDEAVGAHGVVMVVEDDAGRAVRRGELVVRDRPAVDHLVGDQPGPEVAVHRQREAGRERVAHDRAQLAA